MPWTVALSPRKLWQERRPELVCGTLCLLFVVLLARILIIRHLYVETRNAVVQAYFVPLSPQVSGEITRVFVQENQSVSKGQVLCQIDDRPYRNALLEAENLRQSLLPQWISAKTDLRRAEDLLRRGAIAPSVRDRAFAEAHSLEQRYRAAEARSDDARRNVLRTRLSAPSDGIIAFRSARVGMYTRVGLPLFGYVAAQNRWVSAKLRETDLSGVHLGDPVEVRFDSLPGRKFEGRLESFSPASEVPFAAIPDDFSAGNFSKYVQWMPVRIQIQLRPEDEARVPVGVNSEIRMRRRQA